MDPLTERLAAAKMWLTMQGADAGPSAPRDLPYLATALYALKPVATTAVSGISADSRWRLYLNPVWIADTPVPEIGRELAHLVWHLLMDHAGRARGMNVDLATAEQWHQAAEITIDETLDPHQASPESTSDEVRNALAQGAGRLGSDQAAEQYYAFFSRLPAAHRDDPGRHPAGSGCRCGSCCDGIERTTDLPADADIDEVTQGEADLIRMRVAIDYHEGAAKLRGTAPGEALRWARGITKPTIPWESQLRQAVRRGIGWTSGRMEPTWTRPSRRQSVTPAILQPGWRRRVPGIAMVVDTSGSADDFLLGAAMAAVDGVIRALGIPGGSVTVLACDAAVGAVTRVRRAADATLVGGGGTDMRVGIAAASQQRPRPDLIIVFTDGYTPWPATPPPGSGVIAAMLGRPGEVLPASPSWARRVACILQP